MIANYRLLVFKAFKNIYHFKKFLIFLLAGVGTTTIYIGLFSFLFYIFHINHIIAISIAFAMAALFQFFANRKITFKASGSDFSLQLFRYCILLLINYVISVVILQLSVYLVASQLVGLIAAAGITPFTGYLLFKYWVFPNYISNIKS